MRKVQIISGNYHNGETGWFHGFYVWGENPGGVETMALVEFSDGSVDNFCIRQIKFESQPAEGD